MNDNLPSEAAANETPDVSILIPAHNAVEMTLACLASLAEHTRASYEVLLVDDASDPDAAAAFRAAAQGRVRLIRNETRRSFSQNNNLAASQARGRHLCLLNNDTLVTACWLQPMIDLLDREPEIGVLGNKHLFPQRPGLHHAGMAFDDKKFPIHLHPHSDPDLPAVNYRRDVPCVTFACVLIPARVYRELGGLDEAYRNGFEDCDFCLRAREAGYRIVYTPASTIYHYGQATPGRQDFDNANWKTFHARWADRITPDLARLEKEDRAFTAREKAAPRLRKPYAPGLHLAVDLGVANAFTWATVELAEALARRGVPVSVPPATLDRSIAPAKARFLKGVMRRRPLGTWHVKWSHHWPHHMKRPLFGDINAEFFCTNYAYRPDARHRDLWMRHVLLNGYRKLPVCEFNRQILLDAGVPAGRCAVAPLGYAPEIPALFPEPRAPRTQGDLHLLLVTNSHDLPRYGTDLAVQALAAAFGPGDPVVVHIKDYGPPTGRDVLKEWIDAQPRFPRVIWHRAFLSKEDLLRLYASCDVQLAPFRGEGFAMKILDAMAVGVPTLLPLFGGPTEFADASTCLPLPFDRVEVGACYDRDHSYVGEGAEWAQVRVEAMTDLLRGLPERRDELARLGRAAFEHVRPRFTWDRAAERLMEALEGWKNERHATLVERRSPDRVPLTVLIPTKDRLDTLDKTLTAYAAQTVPRDGFEVLLVNDHGDRPALDGVAARHAEALDLRVVDNAGPGGPAAARNAGLERARGGIVLITGDDIVPANDFLAQHLEAHRRFPRRETAFVGLTLWHDDLPHTPFMEHITGPGGQQFLYEDMHDTKPVPFDRLYTSNCSLKRAFLAEQEEAFSAAYRFAAYEDVEFGYRLHLRGLQLRYWKNAQGRHLHPMDAVSFLQRQRKVGRMLTVLTLQHPSFIPNEHSAFLRALEFARARGVDPRLRRALAEPLPDLTAGLAACYDTLLQRAALLEQTPADVHIERADQAAWVGWLHTGGTRVWDALNDLVLRTGMAEEWASCPEDEALGRAWAQLIDLPRVLGPQGGKKITMPFSAHDDLLVLGQADWLMRLADRLYKSRLTGPIVRLLAKSEMGVHLRRRLRGE